MVPVCLDLTDRLVVIVGGGTVGRRKAAALLGAGARVRLVAPEARPDGFDDLNLTWLSAPYAVEHLDGAALVFVAATPEVNRLVVADAVARGMWVNSATEPEEGDFTLPAVLRRGELVVAVSTGGAAPYLARAVRDRLAAQFDDAFAEWVALLAELRPVVRKCVADESERRGIFERLCRWEWLDRLRAEGAEVVRRAMRADAGLGDV